MYCSAIDSSQLADVLADSETLFTLDNGIRAHIATDSNGVDFLAFVCPATGNAFIVNRSADGEGVHSHARQVLATDFGK